MNEYLVIYEKAPSNWAAYVPDLPGCIATGKTKEDCERNMATALSAHLAAMRADGDPIPEPSQFGTVKAA